MNGNDNIYKRVYTVYGDISSKLYPEVVPTILPYESVVDTTYVQTLLSKSTAIATPAVPNYDVSRGTDTFAKRGWAVEFETGKATFTAATSKTLVDLLNQVSVTGLPVKIIGHTDNIGNPTSNLALSKARAEAVKNWVLSNAPSTFPVNRVQTLAYGDTAPIADNATSAGRAKNRRVEIELLNTAN